SVGLFTLEGMDAFLAEIKQALGESEQAEKLSTLLSNAYSRNNLASATRYLVNELFGKYGLVVLDGDSKVLKQEFIPEIKKDIFENTAYKNVTASNEKLKQQGYDAQVTPREINIFYTDKNLRERIVKEKTVDSSEVENYKVLNTDITFTKEEIEKLIDTETERFSPNVVLRPMYQQKILPNVVYVGGPGELAYWLQYKAMCEEAQISFPVLMPRNFIFYLDKNLQQKMQKLNLSTANFFTEKDKLIKSYALSQQPFSLDKEKEALKSLYHAVRAEISKVDKTLEATSEAELQKNLKGLEMLEQKGIRSIKQKNEQAINQIETTYGRLFPTDVPQERYENFLRFALTNIDFIEDIKNNTSSFADEKGVVVLNEE
ncbi:MAG: bacillithiol biosynthesis cysteine-adding enzyme BshC, partial [Bacteroidia bacterium]